MRFFLLHPFLLQYIAALLKSSVKCAKNRNKIRRIMATKHFLIPRTIRLCDSNWIILTEDDFEKNKRRKKQVRQKATNDRKKQWQ